MIRAALISIIYRSSLDLVVGSVEAESPVSLMGADVERVITTLQWVISTAPNIVQVAVAIWILESRLGAICVAPVVVVLGESSAQQTPCMVMMQRIISTVRQLWHSYPAKPAKQIRPRQRQWMQAVQKRLSSTSDALGSIGGMKMLGLTAMITKIIQDLRVQELNRSKRFRYVQIVNITLGMLSSQCD